MVVEGAILCLVAKPRHPDRVAFECLLRDKGTHSCTREGHLERREQQGKKKVKVEV